MNSVLWIYDKAVVLSESRLVGIGYDMNYTRDVGRLQLSDMQIMNNRAKFTNLKESDSFEAFVFSQ